MSFPRYPKYKDSGVEWLGEVPEGWEVRPLRTFAQEGRKSFIDGDWIEAPFITDDGVRLIQTGNIGVGSYKEQGFRFISQSTFDDLQCTGIDPGDVLICRLADPVGRACLAPDLGVRMITSVDVCILKTHTGICAQFVVYLLSSSQYLSYMESQCRGGTRDRVSRSFLGMVQLPIPPSEEQLAIAAFLDRETANIDALIAEQNRLIELLQEKRQAVISHAVTKGLDPNVRMKPSGVEWLGEVPEHWEVVKMKWVAEMASGHTPDRKVGAYWENTDIPWVSLNDTSYLKDHDYITETAYYINELGLANSSARLLPAKTVVFSRDATIGRCAITTMPMAVSQHFIAWICGEKIIPEYLLLRLRSMTDELDRLTTGATLKTIGMPDVRTLVTPVPPLQEQLEIVDVTRSQATQLDSLISTAQSAITLLQERRSALISAAVTGQIDVRNYQPQDAA